jgi:hypothetical protein
MTTPDTHPPVEPLDPDSDHGRAIAEALSQVLAELQHELRTARRRKSA